MDKARIANLSHQSLLARLWVTLPAATLMAAVCLLPAPAGAQMDQEAGRQRNGTEVLDLPLSGPAYAIAREAYAAYDAKDYATAIAKVREAIRQRPDVDSLKVLLLEAIEASGQLQEAEREAQKLLAEGNRSPQIIHQMSRIKSALAQKAAESVYAALEKNDFEVAISQAQEAVRLNPDQNTFRHLLILAQLRARRFAEAETSASDALASDSEDAIAATFRAVSRLNESNGQNKQQAIADFERALAQDRIAETEKNEIRLIAADYLIAIGEFARAENVLSDFSGDRKQKDARIARIAEHKRSHSSLPSSVSRVPVPKLECRETPYDSVCFILPGLPGADAGFPAAAEAYQAASTGNYSLAIAKIREAIRLSPENEDYRTAEKNMLAAQKAGVSFGGPAAVAAGQAYDLQRRGDFAGAIRHAREAVALAPRQQQLRALLVNLLISAGREAEAIREINTTFAQLGTDAQLLQQRGYLLLQANEPARAVDDFANALPLVKSPSERRTLLLAMADAATAADQPERALDALSLLGTSGSFDVAYRRGNILRGLERYDEALAAFTQAVTSAPTAEDRARAKAAQISAYVSLGQQSVARQLFETAKQTGELNALPALDVAYLALRVGDPVAASQQFTLVQKRGELRGLALVDAAYAARQVFDNDLAVELLKSAIDTIGPTLEPQYLWGLRREVADLTRTWGAYTSVTYGAVGSGAFSPQTSSGSTTQTGTEIYWRPPVIGNRNGSTLDFFMRNFTTLHDDLGGPVGFRTMQGSFGVRWKPLQNYNVIVEAARLFRIGSDSREDTMVRAAYFDGRGGDLRMDVPSWWLWQVSGEVGHYFDIDQTFATLDAKLGRSFRLDSISDRLMITPFVGVTANFDNLLDTKWAAGAGPGINARYWFREDKYNAPRSYVDLNVQYRFKLLEDDRAQGLFASLTLAY
ncbi:bacteriophage N4 adsorption protein A [Pseudochelatococcus contaminans]|uniref:Tetratricopeptide (TPR) repeat protein n=1 Tax=Pseudochelatococcus contaminans TaxID=1538103 RepID=A0A7W5Z5U1_9HYPH|nr:bacteriophage N4 adsorption protein A [Pseudochelatococcus contaminans]MBB3810672.1 tetratricopeptide (TPR) repeat protein [Pseudochelatococcus contaminans]